MSKVKLFLAAACLLSATTYINKSFAQQAPSKTLYLDIHHMGEGNVTAKAVADAHKKDLQVQNKYGVKFIQYWVDEKEGNVYCLSESSDGEMVKKTHAEAHGLIPNEVSTVESGQADAPKADKLYFLDVHYLGAGNVTALAVADAHKKDLEIQEKYGVNFVNYWVDEEKGVVYCLSQAKSADDVIETHTHAHGLIPDKIEKVTVGE